MKDIKYSDIEVGDLLYIITKDDPPIYCCSVVTSVGSRSITLEDVHSSDCSCVKWSIHINSYEEFTVYYCTATSTPIKWLKDNHPELLI